MSEWQFVCVCVCVTLLLSLSLHAEGFFFDILWPLCDVCWCFHFLFHVMPFFFGLVVAAAVFLFFCRHRIFIQFEKLCFVVNLRMCHNFCLLRFIAAHWKCVSMNVIWPYMQRHTNNSTIFHFSKVIFTWSAFPCSYSLIRSFTVVVPVLWVYMFCDYATFTTHF